MANLKVAYILLRFPCMTETFIAEEIQKIQDKGIEVCIYSLLEPRDTLVHPVSQRLLAFVRTAPGLGSPSFLAAQFHFLIKSPGRYFKLPGTLLRQPAPGVSFYLKRFDVFLKSAWVAGFMESCGIRMVQSHFAWLSAASAWIVSEQLDLITCKAARVITISQKNKPAMLEQCNHLAEVKIHVIHCGVDLSFFQAIGRDDEKTAGPLRITSVGSLITKKGHEHLIRACGRLKERVVDFHCTIIGIGEHKNRLQALIDELGLQSEVELAGGRSQVWVRDQLTRSDVFALACVQA